MVEIHWALGLSGFAAFVRYAQAFTVEKVNRPAWEWGVASIHTGTGAFVGLLAAFAIGKSWELRYAYVAIALAGYGGPKTLDFAWTAGSEVVRSMLARAAQGQENKGPKG